MGMTTVDPVRFTYDVPTISRSGLPSDRTAEARRTEWDPAIGTQRTWYETLDHDGNVRIVRPEAGDPKVHYTFGPDGSYTGSR